MNGEEDFRVENTEEAKKSRIDICVLLLDRDATCLANLSEMIKNYGYQVVATTRADDLPLIINNKDKKIDLVLAEFRFIEMNNYELLEKIRFICEAPVVVVGANGEDAIVECLCREATICLKKPLMEDNIEYLWQFVFRSQRDFLSKIDTNPPEKKYSITHTQSLGDKLKHSNKKNEVKTEDLDEYKGEKFESGDQKNLELRCPEMQNKIRETDDKLSQGKKRKEIAGTDTGEHTEKNDGSDLGEQKKPKLIYADDLQKETQEAIPNIEEANNERKGSTEIKKNGEGSENEKKNPEPVCMEEELEKWSTQPVTDFAACEYEYQDRDFWPLESVGESVGPREIPLSPRESSNKNVAVQNHGTLDEELMQDGISLADLEFDLMEGHDSTCNLENKATLALFSEIYTDLANDLKP